MGGDGGTVTNNRKFLKSTKNSFEGVSNMDSSSLIQRQKERSHLCALTGQRLVTPIVACELGNLYNKESLIRHLLARGSPNEAAGVEKASVDDSDVMITHIRGLKDVKDVILNPPSLCPTVASSSSSCLTICPVTQIEFTGTVPFVCVWSTGYLLSQRAIKEVGIDHLQIEYGPFSEIDLVMMLPQPDCLDSQKEAMMIRRQVRDAARAAKKGGKKTRDKKERTKLDASKVYNQSKPGKLKTSGGVLMSSARQVGVAAREVMIRARHSGSDAYKELFTK
jgi:hypothetical protein